MAAGKVTGTEQARFGVALIVPTTCLPLSRNIPMAGSSRVLPVKDRMPVEKITGDDWERGDHVTGTEGASAIVRNQSRRGAPMGAMGARASDAVLRPRSPVSRVTGSSGNTENGSLITFSGGARG